MSDTRPSRTATMMKMAEVQSERGTCARLRVGCVIHREGRILSTGYNGTPAGIPHCDHECNCGADLIPDLEQKLRIHLANCATAQPCTLAAHAERNAIDWAARHGIRLEGASLVTTHSPCYSCAGSIINAGIREVVAGVMFRDPAGWIMLEQAGVIVIQSTEVV